MVSTAVGMGSRRRYFYIAIGSFYEAAKNKNNQTIFTANCFRIILTTWDMRWNSTTEFSHRSSNKKVISVRMVRVQFPTDHFYYLSTNA